MGWDFEEFFNEAGDKVQAALDDIKDVGEPGIKAALEQWGIDVLTAQNKETQKELNDAVKRVTANEPAPGSFGAALSATVENSVFANYGGLILGGIAGLIILGIFLGRK